MEGCLGGFVRAHTTKYNLVSVGIFWGFWEFVRQMCAEILENLRKPSNCGRSSVVEHQLPKLRTRVQLPSPAPSQALGQLPAISSLRELAFLVLVRHELPPLASSNCRKTAAR
jgi:hypothetical protein